MLLFKQDKGFYRITCKNFFCRLSPLFSACKPPNCNPPKKVHCISDDPVLSSTTPNSQPPGNKGRKHLNLSASNYFSQSHLFSVDIKSPQARFTAHHKPDFSFLAHHKQDFSFLIQTLNHKVIRFSFYISLRLQIPYSPTANFIFNSSRKI